MERVDIIIVGAGVVGLAVAAEAVRQFPGREIVLLERHDGFGQDTSSRNSEVIHAGLYYRTGSLKAQLCVAGRKLLYAFCREHAVPHKAIGKLIIARDGGEIESLQRLYRQGIANGVEGLSLLGREALAELEPEVQAVMALYSQETGIIDSHRLMAVLETQAQAAGAIIAYKHIVCGARVIPEGYGVAFIGPDGHEDMLGCRCLINCAGLYADELPAWLGIDIEAAGYRLYPVKGEYFSLAAAQGLRVQHLIYPPPLPGLQGLGTHLTKSLDGMARLGPNAIYVEDREDYSVAVSHQDDFYQAVRYLPFVVMNDLSPAMAGIRPKLQAPGAPAADFVIRHEEARGLRGLIDLIGIESPGLTSCLAIARYVSELVRFVLC